METQTPFVSSFTVDVYVLAVRLNTKRRLSKVICYISNEYQSETKVPLYGTKEHLECKFIQEQFAYYRYESLHHWFEKKISNRLNKQIKYKEKLTDSLVRWRWTLYAQNISLIGPLPSLWSPKSEISDLIFLFFEERPSWFSPAPWCCYWVVVVWTSEL